MAFKSMAGNTFYVLPIVALIIFTGCGSSAPTTKMSDVPGARVQILEQATSTANTEVARETIEDYVRSGNGDSDAVLLTLRGALAAEEGDFTFATAVLYDALRLVQTTGTLRGPADLAPYRPHPEQHEVGNLPLPSQEAKLLDAFRSHFHDEITNDELLERLVERSSVVRYPPLYPQGAGLVLEVIRQHLGDDAFRIQLLSYSTNDDGKLDKSVRAAAANLIVTAALAGDREVLIQARSALIGALNENQSVSSLTQHVRLCVGLADYLLGYSLTLPLPRKARQLLSSSAR